MYIALFLAAAAAAADIRLEGGLVKVVPGAGGAIEVYSTNSPGAPPVLGKVRTEGEALVFEPRFPFEAGLTLRVLFRDPAGAETRRELIVPAAAAKRPTTRLEHIFPTSRRLPENQLKFYLQFTAPMSRGEAYGRIHLLEESGKPVDLPFLELDQELWDAAGQRLTLFFDPGRVKREVLPNREAGQPLIAGKRYKLVVDAAWRDAAGMPLAAPFEKEIEVIPADRTSPSPARWRIAAPKAATREPLAVDMGEPMDHGLLLRELGVTFRGQPVAGAVAVDREETRWLFTPDQNWARGGYEIAAGTALEDLAGNRLDRLFDVDKFDRAPKQVRRQVRRLRFDVH